MTDAAWLAGPQGRAALEAAESAGADDLATATALRRDLGLNAEQAAAVLTQRSLRRLARARYGIGERRLLTRDGLEQATRPEVAARRARMLAAAGVERVIDLTAGLGFDAMAFVAVGLTVVAFERDATTAAFCAANVPGARVVTGDGIAGIADLDLGPGDALFVDPARRDPVGPRDLASGRARPERDPERWSPPWSTIAALPHPRIVVKTAPGFRPPTTWHAEWVSVHRTVVECTAYSWPILPAQRRAVILRDGRELAIDADDDHLDPVGVGDHLYEPDPAIVRAGALDALAGFGLRRIDEDGTWLTGLADPMIGDAVQGYRVITELDGSTTEQRRLLDSHGVRSLTVASRDARVRPADVLRELRRPEGPDATIVVARHRGRIHRWLVQPE